MIQEAASIRKLRERVQIPRRYADTFYGVQVMRRLSVYLTAVAIRWRLMPDQVTWASLFLALGGLGACGGGHWGWGVLGLNVYYLLDHVDGELARYGGHPQPSGVFFDMILNYLVHPLTFVAMAAGLRPEFGDGMIFWGVLGMFAYVMLGAIPMCEDSIVLYFVRREGSSFLQNEKDVASPDERSGGLLRRIFSQLERWSTYPDFLLVLTLCVVLGLILGLPLEPLMAILLVFYASLASFVWTSKLFYKIFNQTLDSHPLL